LIVPMAIPSLPSRQAVLRTAETLAIAAAGGTTLAFLGLPAGLVIGALIAVAAAGLAGRPMAVPAPLSRVIFVLVGISLGAAVSPETLQGLAAYPFSIAMLAISTLLMLFATSAYLRFAHGWDRRSALLGASPGALAQVMALSAEYRADARGIAIVQTMRVVMLTVGIPAGLAWFGLTASGSVLPNLGGGGPAAPFELTVLVAVSTVSAVAVWWFRLPGGLLFGAMLGSGVLHGTGLIAGTLPAPVAFAAIVGIGAMTGSRFANTDMRTLLRYVGAALGSFSVAIAIASLTVVILTAVQAVSAADAVVAFAPGAQDSMMVLALALHLDPVFVGAMHLSRYLLVSLLVPLLVHRAGPRPPPKDRPPGPRPTIED
jgi:uncharacterized protein